MIFPSLFAQVETGLVSQISMWGVLAFSYVINKSRKIVLGGALLLGLFFTYNAVNAGMWSPYKQQAGWYNTNYYGNPYGMAPVYPYPRMPFHATMGPSPYYFRPYGPSPYQPPNCVQCMMRYQQYQMPFQGMQGAPITKVTVPLRHGAVL